MLWRPSNIVLLDEPTNHLDMRAKDVLLESLAAFTGTVVFVSHDRYFIDKLATRVFEIGDGEVRVFPGNYEDYLWRKSGAPIDLNLATNVPVAASNGTASEPAKPIAAQPAKRLNPMKLKQMQQQRTKLEEDIGKAEAEIAHYESELATFRNAEESLRLTN